MFEEDTKRMFQKECKQVFGNLIQRHDTSRQTKENDVKLLLLCHILEGNDNVDTSNEYFSAWLPKLFEILTSNEFIPVHIIDTFTSLAKHNNEKFRNLLNDQIVQVIGRKSIKVLYNFEIQNNTVMITENMFKAKVSTSSNELAWKKQIGNLLYWVTNENILPEVQQLLNDNQKDQELCSHIKEIICIKISA